MKIKKIKGQAVFTVFSIIAIIFMLATFIQIQPSPAYADTSQVVFTTSGTWTVPAGITSVEILVVAGGGGGGGENILRYTSGGGGAGGLRYQASYSVTPGQVIPVTVGSGGSGGSGSTAGGNGGNSVFGSITAIGGGGGGTTTGRNGGSGGGGAVRTSVYSGGTGTAGQGYAGGKGYYYLWDLTRLAGGGGGGAGTAGANGVSGKGGNGGIGLYYGAQFGTSVGASGWFAGGGGGGSAGRTAGTGGTGGGANGGSNVNGASATANTGGGGGGTASPWNCRNGGNGGSGVIIVKYTTSSTPTYTITFNSDGGSAVASITQAAGTAVTAPAAPTKSGYTFAGWSPALPATMPVGGAALTATWTVNSYTITFNSDGGSAVASITQAYGSTVTAPTAPTKAGYTFNGWSPALPATMPVGGAALTATWTVNSYTITFNSNGGSAVASITQAYGSTVTAPTAPTKAGYTFNGWSPALPATMPVGGAALTAQWSVNSYTVTFNSNGGTGTMAPQTASAPTALTTNSFTRTGYMFSGWNTIAGGTGTAYANGASYPFTASATLYAQWTAIQYTITFNSDGGSAVASITQAYGSTVTAPANPTKAGYTFNGWSPALPATMPVGGAALTATWTAIQYTITFNSDGGSAVASITQAAGTAVTAPAAPTKAGYTFNGWSPALPATMPVGGAALTATWTVNSYTITFNSNGGSAVASITQAYGSTVTAPTAPTKAGYTFAGWSPALPATMPVGGAALTATWTAIQYTITFNSDGGSAVASITQAFGTAVTAPAAPTKAGYTFAGWSPALPATMPVGGAALTATWTAIQYTITFNSDGGSAVASITQAFGTAVTAPAAPTKAGYTFAGWSPALPATMPVGGAALTAQWTAIQYTITFNSDGGSAVASITQAYGTAVTAPANPTKAGYTFAGWSPALPATMPVGGAALTATWTVNSYTITFNSDGGSAVASITQAYGSTVTAPTAPTKAGYTFAGWSPALPATMPVGGAALTATWTVNSYTITFNSDGGSAVASITQAYGSTVTAPTAPTKAGYTFAGWSPALPATMPVGGAALTAQWTAIQYTITFNSDGGSAVASITQAYGTAVTAPANPTKAGYTFAGWSPALPATMPVGGAALTATWTVNSYTITFNSDGGSAVASITQAYGSTVTAPTAPTKAGYTFAGWSPALPATMPVGGAALTATWTVNSYTITFNSDGGSAVASITQAYGSTVTAPTAPTKAGYTFAGWSPALPATMPVGGAALTATWTEIIPMDFEYNIYKGSVTLLMSDEYAVFTQSQPTSGGSVNISVGGAVVNNARTFTMDAASFDLEPILFPDMITGSGMDFYLTLNLDEDSLGTLYTAGGAGDVDVSSVTTAYAAPQTTTTIGDGTMDVAGSALSPVALSGTAVVWYQGEPMMTVQLAMTGYMTTGDSENQVLDLVNTENVFSGSTINASGIPFAQTGGPAPYAGTNGKLVLTIGGTDVPDLGVDFQAIIELYLCQGGNCPSNEYTITFNSDGGSAVASITQAAGTAVTAPAAPTKEGYTFNGWSPALPATMPVGGATLTAQWSVNSYTITFNSNGGSAVASITQAYGTAVTAPTAPTKAGYTFTGWSPALPATMPVGGATLTAQWSVIPTYTITFNSDGGSAVASITQAAGTAVTAPANPTKVGYTFAGWSPALPATMPVGGAALMAQWSVNSYTITFNSDGGSAVASITQAYGTAVTAPANPTKAGYTFAGWSPALPATMPVGGAALTAQWTAAVTPWWVYYSTYTGQTATYWKFTKVGQETLTPGTDPGYSTGGLCDKFEGYTYQDAACTTLLEAKRTIKQVLTITLTLHSPMYDWRQVDDHQLRQRYNSALASVGGEATNWLYYRNYTPNPGFGAPFTGGEGWSFTEQIDSSVSAGDKTTDGITSAIASATEPVILTVNGVSVTFTCYKNTWTQSGKTIIEYWDASGAFPYAPVKIVDSVNFINVDTKVLSSTNVLP